MPDYRQSLEFGSFLTPSNSPARTPVEHAVLCERVGYDLVTFQVHRVVVVARMTRSDLLLRLAQPDLGTCSLLPPFDTTLLVQLGQNEVLDQVKFHV